MEIALIITNLCGYNAFSHLLSTMDEHEYDMYPM